MISFQSYVSEQRKLLIVAGQIRDNEQRQKNCYLTECEKKDQIERLHALQASENKQIYAFERYEVTGAGQNGLKNIGGGSSTIISCVRVSVAACTTGDKRIIKGWFAVQPCLNRGATVAEPCCNPQWDLNG
jgi:hypothetical protein